jgi:hypothetical protein
MRLPRLRLSPLLTTILTDIRALDFYSQDGDYAPDYVKEDSQFETVLPDCSDGVVMWSEDANEAGLCWSFHVQYMTADFSGDPYSDAAMIEIGLAANFAAEDVDSTIIVTLELSGGPSNGDDDHAAMTPTRTATPSIEAWRRFKAQQLEAAIKRGFAMAEAKRADWSEHETDSDEHQ